MPTVSAICLDYVRKIFFCVVAPYSLEFSSCIPAKYDTACMDSGGQGRQTSFCGSFVVTKLLVYHFWGEELCDYVNKMELFGGPLR